MRQLHQPHDRFFRAAFGRADLARELLADALPPGLIGRLDLDALEVSGESFVDPELASHQSDLRVRTRLRGSPLLVYVLVEHKSSPDRWTRLQLLRYVVRIWERERGRNPRARTLPPLVPLIVYHGRRRWRHPLSFAGYFLPDAELAPFVPGFTSLILDLRQRGDDMLTGSLQYQAALRALKHALSGLRPHLAEILRALAALPMEEDQKTFVSALLEYILQAGNDVEARDLETEFEHVGSAAVREVYMTVADRLIEKGKLEGELEDKRQVLLRLLEKRFGRLPASARRRITGSLDREALDRA
ncbi:MAG: Rpn family recombination-promoting nuclease/putative transposase, partial [Spirochaetales bacterium]|nr:Rpn family recombination-promoting nuclease/putative transposase [Spirochaetales bacterium]